MPICVPISDMKDTAKFTELVLESPEPIIVTKNGYDAFVVQRSDTYSANSLLSPKEKLMERILEAEDDIKNGRIHDGDEFERELRREYGL